MKIINLSKIHKDKLEKAMDEILEHTLAFKDVLEDVKKLYKKDKFTPEVIRDAITIMEGKTDLVKLYYKKYKKRQRLGVYRPIGISKWIELTQDIIMPNTPLLIKNSNIKVNRGSRTANAGPK